MAYEWPKDFSRVPTDDWTTQPVESLALKYDSVKNHGWYRNLDPTVAELVAYLQEGHLLVDYSGGTGILFDRLFPCLPGISIGAIDVDSSPKFLRLALEKYRDHPAVAFRLIRYLKGERRLQFVDEVLPASLLKRGVDALVSTNAIHLYYDLDGTLRSWRRAMRPNARVFVQSGNIRNPSAGPREWIIDETVESIHRAAMEFVATDPRWAAYRAGLGDPERMAGYDALRRRYFLPVRPLDHYLEALERANFRILRVSNSSVEARVEEWYQFLSVYHEGVLGWVGGTGKIEGGAADPRAVEDRLVLLRAAMDRVFGGHPLFACCWTYVTGVR